MGPSLPSLPGPEVRRADFSFAAAVGLAILATSLLYLAFPHIAVVLLLSALLSYALLPLVDRFDQRIPRTVSVLAVACLGAGLLFVVGALVAPAVAREFEGLGETLGRTREVLRRLWGTVLAWLPDMFARWIERFVATVWASARRASPDPKSLSHWASAAGQGIAAALSGMAIVPLFVFLMLRGYHRVVKGLASLVPVRWQARFAERSAQLDRVLSGFVRGQLLVALVLAAIYSGAFLAIGIPLAVLVGVLAGLGELVPYLGGFIALVLGTIMALAGGQPLDVLWVLVTFAVVQTLEGTVIGPMIVGHKAKLGPVAVIVALSVGVELFGFVGLLIAVPAAAALKVAVRAALDGYQNTPFYGRAQV